MTTFCSDCVNTTDNVVCRAGWTRSPGFGSYFIRHGPRHDHNDCPDYRQSLRAGNPGPFRDED